MTGPLARVPAKMADDLQSVIGMKFPPGHTPGLKFMSHLWEDLRATHRCVCMCVVCVRQP
jgi:hypothetical protein